ncbi:hypothetical protein [Prescottella agglutinans]|uniref:Uncharacterized protein n=1 Tax=Prescottella agglutinans TaxID=1644129 RepID=A0ABT6ML68_9NOCA|nr:hypothetical protein [Prescottella agglutinans]MDH6285064.1 hypothetical protein [Prescottella agglutinans]
MSESSAAQEIVGPERHDLMAEMSWLAFELAQSLMSSNPKRALGWTDRALAYHPIDPNEDPANEYELLELRSALLQRLGRASEADATRAQILRDASTSYRLTLACMADEHKTYRNWYSHDMASVMVWRRALLRDVNDAITGGDFDQAWRGIIQVGEFSAAKFRPDSGGELTKAVGRLTRVTDGAGLSADAAYRSLDRLTREILPRVVGAVGGESLARRISALAPVTCLADASTSESGVPSTAAVWTHGWNLENRRVHPVREGLDEFLDSIEYREDPFGTRVSRSEVIRLTAVALDEIGIPLGLEVTDMADANLVWPHRLAASSARWMTMWAAVREEWTASHHVGEGGDERELPDDRISEWETVWETGWRTISGDLFRVIHATVTRIVASSLDMPSDAAVRMLFTPRSPRDVGKSPGAAGIG